MNAYERHIFNGSCPFTDKPCDKDIDCSECVVNHEERTMLDDEINEIVKQEPSGDLISRQAVLNTCEQSINILEAVDRIMDLPSVEQEPKREQGMSK